jgi:hypothetical protein
LIIAGAVGVLLGFIIIYCYMRFCGNKGQKGNQVGAADDIAKQAFSEL